MEQCNHYDDILRKIYTNIALSCQIQRNECYEQNCFIDVEPNNYPPRIEFEHKTHKIYQKSQELTDDTKRTIFSFNPTVIRISDIHLKEQYRNKKIGKKIIGSIKQIKKSHLPTLKYITLVSLPRSVLIWHKIGFEFYDSMQKNKIRDIIENFFALSNKYDDIMLEEILRNLRSIKESVLIDCSEEIAQHYEESIPMYIKIEQ